MARAPGPVIRQEIPRLTSSTLARGGFSFLVYLSSARSEPTPALGRRLRRGASRHHQLREGSTVVVAKSECPMPPAGAREIAAISP